MEGSCLSIGSDHQASAACDSGGEPARPMVRLHVNDDEVRQFQRLYAEIYNIGLPFESAQKTLIQFLCLLAVASSTVPVVSVENCSDYNSDSYDVTS